MILPIFAMIFGFWFVDRTHVILFSDKGISKALLGMRLSKILAFDRQILLVLQVALFILVNLVLQTNASAALGSLAGSLSTVLIMVGTSRSLIVWSENRLCAHLDLLLSSIILKVRAGKGYRQAIQATASEHSEPIFKIFFDELIGRIHSKAYRSGFSLRIGALIEELSGIDRVSHLAIQRLTFIRSREKMKSDLSRRIGQAKLQARAQAWVMVGFYFAGLVWMFSRGEFSKAPTLFLISFTLFAIGTWWLLQIGQKTNWKT